MKTLGHNKARGRGYNDINYLFLAAAGCKAIEGFTDGGSDEFQRFDLWGNKWNNTKEYAI